MEMDLVFDKADPKPAIRSDAHLLGLGGAGLLALAGAFLWRDLNLDIAYIVSLVALVGVAVSFVREPRLVAQLGLFTLLMCTVGGGAWFALTRSQPLLLGLAVAFGGAVAQGALCYPRARVQGDLRRMKQIVYVLVPATLAATWAFYFRFFTLGFAEDSPWRRLVLTLLWLLCGVVLLVRGNLRREIVLRHAGYMFTAVALLKALCYDTTHMGGLLRIAVLACSGLLMLSGSLFAARGRAEAR